MSSTVKKLEITYNQVNERNVFTCGDTVSGQISVEVAKDCQINSLLVKFKGKADVLWTERHGKITEVYHSKDKYFSVKQYIIRDKKDDKETNLINQTSETYPSVLAPGIHVYPFSFQFPYQDLPSSFKGSDGKIVYLLEARLSRSMRLGKTESTTLNFVAKPNPNSISNFMVAQHGSKDKKMLFTSGTIAMDVNLGKSGFFQGEGLKVFSSIKNNSNREIKPKYCIYNKHSFFARGKRRLHTKDLVREVGPSIPALSSEDVTHVITIPQDADPSILNCNIIKSEYRLRVYLDIKYATDPEIKFDIVILPALQVSEGAPPPAGAGFGFEPSGSQNPAVWGFGSTQPPAGPYGNQYPPGCAVGPPQPFGNQNPPVWGFGPPQPPAGPFGNQNPPGCGVGPSQPFGNQNPPVWGFGPPQPPAGPFGNQNPPACGVGAPQPSAPQPDDLPPPYGAHTMYPPLNDFDTKHQ